MDKRTIPNIILFILKIAVISSINVQQSPRHLMTPEKTEVKLSCRHGDTNYPYMYWYQQKAVGDSIDLIGMLQYERATPEESFKARFNISGQATGDAFLLISKIMAEDSAVYFCAARRDISFADLKFGPGTKLTVLEPNMTVTHPTVTLFPPSPKELCRAKIYKRNVTLVCVATDFYPDHISITWKLNGNDIKPGVATDHTAQQDTDTRFYSMSSRLSVSRTEWMDIKNIFTCNVIFFNGTEPEIISQNITFKEKIPVKVYAMIQLGYIMFVFKSLLYAGFVSILVWKCKGTKEKMLLTENGDIMIS